MANQVRTIINKKWLTAEELDQIKKYEKLQNDNEDIETALEYTGSRLKRLNDRGTIEMIMRNELV